MFPGIGGMGGTGPGMGGMGSGMGMGGIGPMGGGLGGGGMVAGMGAMGGRGVAGMGAQGMGGPGAFLQSNMNVNIGYGGGMPFQNTLGQFMDMEVRSCLAHLLAAECLEVISEQLMLAPRRAIWKATCGVVIRQALQVGPAMLFC